MAACDAAVKENADPEAAASPDSQDVGGSGGNYRKKRSVLTCTVVESKRHRASSLTATASTYEGSPPPDRPREEQAAADGVADGAEQTSLLASPALQEQSADAVVDEEAVDEEADAPAAHNSVVLTAPDRTPVGGGSGSGSVQPEGISIDRLPSWCDRSLVTRFHYPEDAVVDAFCLLPGHPLLALAAESQALLLAKVLENGADPDARDSRGYTALHLACWHARLACIKVLLEAGASLHLLDGAERTAAELAESAGHTDVVLMLRLHEEVQQALQEKQEAEAASPVPPGAGT